MTKLNPFATIENYSQMLNKIASATFFAAVAAVEILRRQIEPLDSLIRRFPEVEIVGLKLLLGTVLIAGAVAFISRMTKFHDRLSSLTGIRKRFDVAEILLPMAVASGVHLPVDRIRRIRKARRVLMKETFYRYASGTTGREEIDKHYITMALDQWSWYWICLEIQTIVLITSLIAFLWGDPNWSYPLALVAFLLLALLTYIRDACAEYARQQVEQILSDSSRSASVRAAFANAV